MHSACMIAADTRREGHSAHAKGSWHAACMHWLPLYHLANDESMHASISGGCSPHTVRSVLGAELSPQAVHASAATVSVGLTVPSGHATQPLVVSTPVVTPSGTGAAAWKPSSQTATAAVRGSTYSSSRKQRQLMSGVAAACCCLAQTCSKPAAANCY